MRRLTRTAFAIVVLAVWGSAQDWTKDWARQGESNRWEIRILGGVALPNPNNSGSQGNTLYADGWSYNLLSQVAEQTTISRSLRSGFGAAASLEYRLKNGPGIRLQADIFGFDLETTSDAAIAWAWADGRSDARASLWTGSGSFKAVPLSLNLVYRPIDSSRISLELSGGPALSFLSLEENAWIAYGFTKIEADVQYIDALKIPMRTELTRWTSLGVVLGAGATWHLAGRLGLTGEIRYLFHPKHRPSWTSVPGIYDGEYFSSDFPILRGVEFNQDDAGYIQTQNKINESTFFVSLFRVQAGLKITL